MQRVAPEKKIHAQAMSGKKNSCEPKIPPPPPPHHFSNGPSLKTLKGIATTLAAVILGFSILSGTNIHTFYLLKGRTSNSVIFIGDDPPPLPRTTLCSWARLLTFIVLISIKVYEWVPSNCSVE